jgi:hypothetical protein
MPSVLKLFYPCQCTYNPYFIIGQWDFLACKSLQTYKKTAIYAHCEPEFSIFNTYTCESNPYIHTYWQHSSAISSSNFGVALPHGERRTLTTHPGNARSRRLAHPEQRPAWTTRRIQFTISRCVARGCVSSGLLRRKCSIFTTYAISAILHLQNSVSVSTSARFALCRLGYRDRLFVTKTA